MSSNILEVKDLQITFHSENGIVPAVNGVTFHLEKGTTLGIVGESGCGKSVTSLSILQLLSEKTAKIGPESSIRLNGKELIGLPRKEMRKIRGNQISMIFQDSMTSLNPVLTIERQMVEPFMLHFGMKRKEAAKAAVEMLRKVGIPAPEKRIKEFPHQLSGGMRQRVMIAMALSCNPDILIADEPTTALDVTIQAQILELMQNLKEEMGSSIILITHDMGVVADMADNIMVMYAGKVVEYSDKRSLFTDPLHPYTKGLLASIPRLDKDVDLLYSIDGMVPDLRHLPSGCAFCERCQDRKKICETCMPELHTVGGRQVCCHKYSDLWRHAT